MDGAVAFCLNQELPNPRALFGRNGADAPPAVFTMDASLQRAGWLRARGALYDPGSHMALFADVPVALVPDEAMGAVPFATDAEDGQPRAGVRYSSATTSAGASVDPLGVARGAASERAGLPATVRARLAATARRPRAHALCRVPAAPRCGWRAERAA